MLKIERVYNIFSWWFIIWYFLYIHKMVSANPFIAAAVTIVWDLYASYFITNGKPNTPHTVNSQMVTYFRMMAIVAAHWIPFLTLPRFIDFNSITTFISLGLLYLMLLYTQGLTPFVVYASEINSHLQNQPISGFFKLRTGNTVLGCLAFGFLFYTAYLLLRQPLKGSLLHIFY